MAVKVKPAADVAAKWGSVTPTRSSYYEAGVKAAGQDWLNNTSAAAKNYQSAVQASNIGQMFAGGVKKAGADKYTNKASVLGTQRFGPGVQAAQSDYQNGVAPMLETISALTLSPRQPRGSQANFQRSVEVGAALTKKRLALRAAGA